VLIYNKFRHCTGFIIQLRYRQECDANINTFITETSLDLSKSNNHLGLGNVLVLGLWVVLLSRPFLGLENKTETWAFSSWDQDRDLDKVHSSLETMVSRSQHWLWALIPSFKSIGIQWQVSSLVTSNQILIQDHITAELGQKFWPAWLKGL